MPRTMVRYSVGERFWGATRRSLTHRLDGDSGKEAAVDRFVPNAGLSTSLGTIARDNPPLSRVRNCFR